MTATEFYRGGSSLTPRPREVRRNSATGQLLPSRGVSVSSRPDNLGRFGGAHQVTNVPPELQIVQVGKDPTHYEIAPAYAMTMEEYEEALAKIVLIPVLQP